VGQFLKWNSRILQTCHGAVKCLWKLSPLTSAGSISLGHIQNHQVWGYWPSRSNDITVYNYIHQMILLASNHHRINMNYGSDSTRIMIWVVCENCFAMLCRQFIEQFHGEQWWFDDLTSNQIWKLNLGGSPYLFLANRWTILINQGQHPQRRAPPSAARCSWRSQGPSPGAWQGVIRTVMVTSRCFHCHGRYQ